ncbi:hypothetical protein BDV96DRAFT_494336 [Lophiotrema nucula]|uniref:25S rRNA (uridine-N(3))-methyltransferase BMT5-like domain-containing protein n=1 Tax=Lophiotrema nucula TaxID=690887 RepID=A0A6A5Z686_9PLEO|nr:hypothetical protein BDV96DRAFT_494336 [Lophiotrema nucula]
MSKNKTKKARREHKREEAKKAASHARKAGKPGTPIAKASKPSAPPKRLNAPKTKTAAPQIQASQKHEIPFGEYDNILLVGEGDFSFTRCLAVEHGCANVTGTSYDSHEDVLQKYPTFPPILSELAALTPPVPLHHAIDATKLHTYKPLRTTEPWDTIAFLFPHTGGLSTDVNRQVRANQALLVAFFSACLEDPKNPKSALNNAKPKNEKRKERNEFLRMGGNVIVTLFEGEPYTLWNIRDLARHAGLKVVESFKFDWTRYPGYHHVRTLGAIEGGGAWKGEEREARMYVFEKVPVELDSEEEREMRKEKSRKRRREDSEEEDEG